MDQITQSIRKMNLISSFKNGLNFSSFLQRLAEDTALLYLLAIHTLTHNAKSKRIICARSCLSASLRMTLAWLNYLNFKLNSISIESSKIRFICLLLFTAIWPYRLVIFLYTVNIARNRILLSFTRTIF